MYIIRCCCDWQAVVETFMPTAVKFHYIFNLRDIGNVFEGLLRSSPQYLTTPLPLYRLWLHECERTFCDRFISESDQVKYLELLEPVVKKWFDGENQVCVCVCVCVFVAS